MDKDQHYVSINISKQKKFIELEKKHQTKQFIGIQKRDHHRIVQKPSEATLKAYSIPEAQPLPISQLKNDYTWLSYKFYSKVQDHRRFKKQLGIPIHNKHKIISTDFRLRLHVPNSPEKLYTLLDIDEDFYNCINGRLFKQQSTQYKSFKIYLNKLLRIKQEIGLKKDCKLNINTNQRKELDIYDKSLGKLTEQAKYLDQFISEDYRKSMIFLERGDKLISEVVELKTELECLASKKFFITSKLIGLDFRYCLQQKYGRFLYYLSPPSWRANNRDFANSVEIEAKGFDLGFSSDEDTFAVIYEKMRKECYNTFVKPALYFNEPKHLVHVFETIEQQQLNHFIHVSHFSPFTKLLHESITYLKDNIAQESVAVTATITYFKSLLDFSEQRLIFLKAKFFKVLHGLFYESVGAKDVLKLFLHLEFCYENVYEEKPMNKDIKFVAEALEIFYMDYSKRLDSLRGENVRCAINTCLESENNKSRKAVIASKELRLYYRLEQELLRAHGLPLKVPTPVLPFENDRPNKIPGRKNRIPKTL